MKKIMNCTLVSVLIITLLTSVFPSIDVLAIDSEAAKKKPNYPSLYTCC